MKSFKSFLLFLVGSFSALYLFNPGMGVFELIPDALPFVGNLDEAAAAALVIAVLRHFGVDLTKAFNRKKITKP